jgi:hypothetical protein
VGREAGIRAEDFFESRMASLCIPCHNHNDFFDFIVNNEFKVEVKSCQLQIKTVKDRIMCGRFDFNTVEEREQQLASDVWVCFIIRQRTEMMIAGFAKATSLPKDKKGRIARYVRLNSLRNLRPLGIEEWAEKIKATTR